LDLSRGKLERGSTHPTVPPHRCPRPPQRMTARSGDRQKRSQIKNWFECRFRFGALIELAPAPPQAPQKELHKRGNSGPNSAAESTQLAQSNSAGLIPAK